MNWEVEKARQIILEAAERLRRCASEFDRSANKIDSAEEASERLRQSMNDFTNMVSNLRLDLFVKYAALCAKVKE